MLRRRVEDNQVDAFVREVLPIAQDFEVVAVIEPVIRGQASLEGLARLV